MRIVGIDIGGTTIKADIYDNHGKSYGYFREEKTAIDKGKQQNGIVGQVLAILADYQKEVVFDGIALSTAGVVDSHKGEILYAGPSIPAYQGVNFRKEIGDKLGIPVAVENDVNCAVLAEAWLGAAQGKQDVVMVTVGTGIGGGFLQSGHLVRGSTFTGGEIGYIPIGETTWQEVASTTALIEDYEQSTGLGGINGKDVCDAVDQGNSLAEAVLDQFIDHLATGLLTLSYALNPEILLIGGGISARSDLLLPRLEKVMKNRIQNVRFLPAVIAKAALGNEAGRIGAVRHFLNQYGEESCSLRIKD
ncbi:ROK family protein [Streptococcus sp. 121]|uniref:ROK family protein n=1 Tax=Streptococcus sp. 121 TaxID=2797637 RepID=UPI0018F0C630|nr:ROK family protein [Streptococcus sp. 121]MBJ6745834.1 ROK family protein [Streptococcus sp. 121]